MVKKDLEIAQKVILGTSNILEKESYHKSSFIYKFTNENITLYQEYLKNRRRVFSITGSGDQVLNSILFGATEIDACDISR